MEGLLKIELNFANVDCVYIVKNISMLKNTTLTLENIQAIHILNSFL